MREMFHISRKVNWHNVRIWDTENPHFVVEHVRDSPKVDVFFTLSVRRVPFFAKKTIIGNPNGSGLCLR